MFFEFSSVDGLNGLVEEKLWIELHLYSIIHSFYYNKIFLFGNLTYFHWPAWEKSVQVFSSLFTRWWLKTGNFAVWVIRWDECTYNIVFAKPWNLEMCFKNFLFNIYFVIILLTHCSFYPDHVVEHWWNIIYASFNLTPNLTKS